jgi:hypothetical protein
MTRETDSLLLATDQLMLSDRLETGLPHLDEWWYQRARELVRTERDTSRDGQAPALAVSVRRRTLAVVALLALVGCRAYHPLDPGPGSESKHYVRLLVVTRAGVQLELTDAVIRSDSLVGTAAAPHPAARVAIAREDVVRIESAELDPNPAATAGGNFLLDIVAGVGRGLGCVFTLFKVC